MLSEPLSSIKIKSRLLRNNIKSLQTALIVGVLSETLVIPPDEKRILASVERQSKKNRNQDD